MASTSYIQTESGNKISRESMICGSQNIVLAGKSVVEPHVILRGDLRRAAGGTAQQQQQQLVAFAMGRYCWLEEHVVLRPPFKIYKDIFSYYPVKMGDFVSIGARSIVEAASIGQGVSIGKDCVIGRFAIIKDYAQILDGSIVTAHTVIPPFAIYGGRPAKYLGDAPESRPEWVEEDVKQRYMAFSC